MPNKKDITTNPLHQQIVTLRGEPVMLDFQLARLYGVETRVLKQAVRRNLDRFPEDFMFRLTLSEANELIHSMRSQFVILENDEDFYFKYAPLAFTEQGVAMLSSVLRSKVAVKMNINIMRAFVAARKLFLQNKEHELAINELRIRMQQLEDALENNLGAVNDLSEQMRQELDNLYNAIGALSIKNANSQSPNPIGYDAIARNYEQKS